jgi:2-methylisocitrate lyase-like PEP mutase family enzyme
MTQANKLKQLLASGTAPLAIGVYDCISARIAQKVGFEVALMSGYGVSGSVLGMPDYGMITMTEMCTMVRNMTRVLDIPLIADGDTGYGNPLNVRRTVMEYEDAGAAAIQLEDQLFPKRCGHMDGKTVIPMEEHCRKIEMAANTRKEMLILARTDAANTHGTDEAIKRCNAYFEAGADFVLIDAAPSKDLEYIRKSIKAPMMINQVEGGKTDIVDRSELRDLGFNLICYPTFALFANVFYSEKMLAELLQRGTSKDLMEHITTFKGYTTMVGLPELQTLEKQYVL